MIRKARACIYSHACSLKIRSKHYFSTRTASFTFVLCIFFG